MIFDIFNERFEDAIEALDPFDMRVIPGFHISGSSNSSQSSALVFVFLEHTVSIELRTTQGFVHEIYRFGINGDPSKHSDSLRDHCEMVKVG